MKTGEKILIVEDERILGELLLQRLNAEGYEAYWEQDGEAGLIKMREIRPDLVLLDILMPKKDGYEVLNEMRSDPELKDTKVIIISNSGQPVELKKVLELGISDYIIKAEFSPEDVLAKMRKYLDVQVTTNARKEEDKKKLHDVTVLIVEDDPFLSSIAATRLKQEGYNIFLATDGLQALSLIESEMPDLVLLDVVMPGMSGFEVLKKVKSDAKFKDVAILMFSNLGQEHEVAESLALGAEEFLVKAKFTPKEVIEKINAILKKKGKL